MPSTILAPRTCSPCPDTTSRWWRGWSGPARTAFDPQLIGEPSFQLSFASTAGLIVFAPALGARLEALLLPAGDDNPSAEGRGLLRGTVELVAVTTAAS